MFAVFLITVLPGPVGDQFLLPLMWHWVGGGFTALCGTACCLSSIFIIMDPELTKRSRWLKKFPLLIHTLAPVAYTLLARWVCPRH